MRKATETPIRIKYDIALPLSIAEQIANEHGGKLWAESRSNINTFYVKLPLISDAMK